MAEKTKKESKLGAYFKGVKTELKKVVWPTKKEAVKYTEVVVVVCAIFAIFFWLLDTGCLAILEKVLNISM